MRARSMIVVVLVLATAPLVAGCGAGGTASMDEKFQKLEYEIANLETVNSSYNMRDFLRETQKYIALVRQYDVLLRLPQEVAHVVRGVDGLEVRDFVFELLELLVHRRRPPGAATRDERRRRKNQDDHDHAPRSHRLAQCRSRVASRTCR